MTQTTDWLSIALKTVSQACGVARGVQQRLHLVRHITKDDRSPVTVADFAVQAIVAMALRQNDNDVNIVGEERADLLRQPEQAVVRRAVVDAVREVRPDATEDEILDAIDHAGHDASSDVFWALDPIDGTKGFLRGQQYAIALARVEQGQVTLGVMGCPNLPVSRQAPLADPDPVGVIYSGELGRGAHGHAPDDLTAWTRIEAGDYEHLPPGGVRACESAEAAHSNQSDSAKILDALGGAGEPVRLDSQCKYAIVARGQADAYLRLPTRKGYVEKIWDHAAGMIIAQEAGAVVTDVLGAPLDFSRGRRLEDNRGILCAARGVHERLVEAIDQIGLTAPV